MTQEILFRYFKGQANPEEERQIGAWLLDTPGAQKEFEQAQFLYEGLVLHGQRVQQRKRLTFKTVFRYAAGIAAAAVLVLATGHIVRRQTVDALSHEMMSLETRPGERAEVTLSDGTTVLLNADSRIEYPVTFQGDERHVKIYGEALFKVQHDEAHPFVVSTFVSDIRVLGTTFNVLADPQERLFSTTLMEGSVRVQSLGDPYANIVSTGGKTIYLTFDDGPSAHTKRLLEVLRKYGVKATFFVTGNHSEYRDRIVEAAADGHTIAVHTYTHNYSVIYKGEKAYFDDFNKVNDIIEDLTGKRATIMRFPGGSSNTISKKSCEGVMTKLVQDMNDLGIQYQDWNVLSGDASSTPIDTAKVISNVKNGITYNSKNDRASIVLQHDTVGYSVDAVESVIKWALENGYTFLPLSMDSPHAHQKVAN